MAISLPFQWKARVYQQDFLNYMFENGRFPWQKRAMAVWHRRAGKDSCMLNTLAVASQMQVGTYWHLLPTLNQGRKVIWNGVDGQGRRMVNQAFPKEIVESANENEMLLKLKNGSFYQVVGSDNYDSLVGTNPLGVVFSEWALADPRAWSFVRPILAENRGFAAFITTPRGKNHAYDMWRMAQASENWFTSRKTVNDTFRDDGTSVITPEMIQMERDEGVPDEVIEQEYFCSWEGINQGSIYGRQLQKYETTNQIVFPHPFLPGSPVYTAWDLGRRDATAVWFYQIVNGEIWIVDYEEGTQMGSEEWLEFVKKKPYAYGTPALPHDAKYKGFSTKYTTFEQFVRAGWQPYVVKNMPRAQGINAVRAIIPFVYFNVGSENVRRGLSRLEGYQYEWDEKLKVFSTEPKHDHNSHGADGFRMLALSNNVISIMNKTKNITVRPRDTKFGPAYMLDELFAERESRQNNFYQRV